MTQPSQDTSNADSAAIRRIARRGRDQRMWFTAPTDTGCAARGIVCVSPTPEHIAQLARAVRSQPLCAGWDIYVVGSSLDWDGTAGDLDLRVVPVQGFRRSVRALEEIMIWLQWYGLYRLNIRVDPGHHRVTDIEARTGANNAFVYTSWSLEAPRHEAHLQRLRTDSGLRFRRAGRHLVACRGPFQARGFFGKLPGGDIPLRLSQPLCNFAMT